jgi:hypothetical protein
MNKISKTKNNVLLHEGYRMSGDDVLYQYHYYIEKIRKLSKKQEVVIVYEVIHSSRPDQEEIKVEIGRVTSFYENRVLVTYFPIFQFKYTISPSYTDTTIKPIKPYIWEIKYGTADKGYRIGQVDTLKEGIDKIIKTYENYAEAKNRPKNNPIQTETDEKQDSPHITIEIKNRPPNPSCNFYSATLRYGDEVIGDVNWQTCKETRDVIVGYYAHFSKDFHSKTFETFSEACRHIVDRFLNFHLRNESHRKNKVQNEAISFGPNITLVTSRGGDRQLIEILYRGRVKAEIDSYVTDTKVLVPDSFRGRDGNTYPYRLLVYPLTYTKKYRYFNSVSKACKFAVRIITNQFQKNQNQKYLEESGNELNLNNIRMYTQQEYFDDWNRDSYTKRVVLYNRDTGILGKITGLYRNNVLVPTHYQGKPYKAETLYPRPNPAVPFFVDSIKEGVEKILKELTNSSVEQIKETATFVDKEYSENEQGKKIKWTTRAREFQVHPNMRALVREYILYYHGKLAGIVRYVYKEKHGELLSAYYKLFPAGMWFGGMPPPDYDIIDSSNLIPTTNLSDINPLPSPAQAIKMMIDRIESSGATKYNIIGKKSK